MSYIVYPYFSLLKSFPRFCVYIVRMGQICSLFLFHTKTESAPSSFTVMTPDELAKLHDKIRTSISSIHNICSRYNILVKDLQLTPKQQMALDCSIQFSPTERSQLLDEIEILLKPKNYTLTPV